MAKRKTLDQDGNWKPRKVEIVYTDENLTLSAGLGPMVDAFVESPQFAALKQCVPTRNSNASYDPMQFVLPLMAGFWHDYDCLEDIRKLEVKPDMHYRLQGIPSPRAIGDYLREFDEENFTAINEFMVKQSLAARRALAPDAPITIDMDSTSHVQSGLKIEGVEINYKGEWALDSLDSFDELGFCYGFKLRSGSTFSSVGAEDEIKRIFAHLKDFKDKFYRADSAFCNEAVMRQCLLSQTKFTITAHGNIGWEQKINQIENWESWQYSKEETEAAEIKKIKLPEIELGSMHYSPAWAENIRFNVVVKRTKINSTSLFEQDGYKYYGVLTNIDLFYKTKQSVMEHHQKRGNSENFIREKKIHFDLKHFPCLKMNANTAYGLIAMVGYNFLRLVARLDEPNRPHFAKKIREKFLHILGKFVKHARQYFLKIPIQFKKEVENMRVGWAGLLQATLAMG
jgi:hypothetical protein